VKTNISCLSHGIRHIFLNGKVKRSCYLLQTKYVISLRNLLYQLYYNYYYQVEGETCQAVYMFGRIPVGTCDKGLHCVQNTNDHLIIGVGLCQRSNKGMVISCYQVTLDVFYLLI